MRASEWFESQGLTEEAIDHAIAAGGFEHAAALLQSIAARLLKRRELTTLCRWLQQLTGDIAHKPELTIIQVWTEMLMEHFNQIPALLERCPEYPVNI
ncbi:hypothetical protein ACFPYJ_13910 [Paenibacillus solisilvae]|uniref:Uncharacterized protein n=1 Tax=Paenibacillus solisilvae TaxID=2486751 RepID=A0ABW0VWF4_9BACL